MTSKSAELLMSVKRLRPFLFAIMIFTTIVILPFGVAAASVRYSKIFDILEFIWRGFLAIVLLFLIISSSIFGFRLLHIVGKIYKSTKEVIFKEYIRKVRSDIARLTPKMTIDLLLVDLFVMFTILSTVLFIVFDAEHRKWIFFIMEFGGRIFEFLAILMLYSMVKRKKAGKREDSTDASREQSIVMQKSPSTDVLVTAISKSDD